MSEEFKLGCRLPQTPRFAEVPTWADANDIIPESEWDLHDDFAAYDVPVRKQNYNNCTNAALAGAAECLLSAQRGERVTLSMSMLYALCNGGVDEGAFCRDLALKFMRLGLCLESLWPESRVTTLEEPSREVLDSAAKYRGFEMYQVRSWEEYGSALTRRFVLYHGFMLGSAFMRGVGANGVVPPYDGVLANGHAMYSRGLTEIAGVKRGVCVNSWGRSWGKGGLCFLDQSYFWHQRGNWVNLDCIAIRSVRQS